MSRARPAKLADVDLRPPDGRPVENALRNLWVTETALATALNMENLSVLVGFARPHEAGAS